MSKSTAKYPVIYKALIGSQAHGLATPKSDFDYRAVFVIPTKEILSLGTKLSSTQWSETDVRDDTQYEIGHFLNLATKSNPTILEMFVAPSETFPIVGAGHFDLAALFDFVWDSQEVLKSFLGYCKNQRTKYLDKKDGRPEKFATAWLRTLIMADELFRTGRMTLDVTGHEEFDTLKRWKAGNLTTPEVFAVTDAWEERARKSYDEHTYHSTNFEVVNDYLITVRKFCWDLYYAPTTGL